MKFGPNHAAIKITYDQLRRELGILDDVKIVFAAAEVDGSGVTLVCEAGWFNTNPDHLVYLRSLEYLR